MSILEINLFARKIIKKPRMLIAQVITDQTVTLQDYVIWHCDLNYFSDCEILAPHMSSTQVLHLFSTQNPSVQHQKLLSSTSPSVPHQKPLRSTHFSVPHQKPLSSTHFSVQHQSPLSSTPKIPQFHTKN